MRSVPDEIVIERRYRGPLSSGNGGYVCGRLAAFIDGPTQVTLRLPPPLDTRLRVERENGRVLLLDGDALVAEAQPAPLELDVPAPVAPEDAHAARERHVRLGSAAFAQCFVCGDRPAGDGLRIHAGAVPGREPLQAAPWVVEETGPEIVWAAIDCPGAYAIGAAGRGEVVLGRMAAEVLRVPRRGERCVVTAWPLGEEGRKLYAGTALFTEDGELLARAQQTWIEPRPTS
jgi:hypothetical protein